MDQKMNPAKKRVLLSPLDPVHDIGLKMIKMVLDEAGHTTTLLPPDMNSGEIIEVALKQKVDVILLSRTMGYDVAEILGQFVDLAEAVGLRERVKLGIGGMAIKPEIAAELGFDGGFGPQTALEEALAFVEGRPYEKKSITAERKKRDIIGNRSYRYGNKEIDQLLEEIVQQGLDWAEGVVSPGIERGYLRQNILDGSDDADLAAYIELCDPSIKNFYQREILPAGLRLLSEGERSQLMNFIKRANPTDPPVIQQNKQQPIVFIQYGTGCPFMDIAHIKGVEGWGADGVVHFDPSWGAKTEGLLAGFLTHEENGSVITWENLKEIKKALLPKTLWQVRAHRGLNTPETVVLAGKLGADLTKINPVYGSLGGGTDPERLLADAVEAIKLAAYYDLPFDMPTNEELSGVPAYKAFAGMLIVAHMGISLGAKPILQPLFCYSPEMMLSGRMEDNYIDFNAAKIFALRSIIDAPIWAGAPIGFLTHSEERVQSATSTAFHAALAASLKLEGISIASTDEAYSRGPITVPSRIDTLQGVKEAFRFLGSATFAPTQQAFHWAEELEENIYLTLKKVAARGSLVDSLYEGLLGSKEDGAHPGRNGKNTVKGR